MSAITTKPEPQRQMYSVYLEQGDQTINFPARNLGTLEEDMPIFQYEQPGVKEALIAKYGSLEQRQAMVAEEQRHIEIIEAVDLEHLDALHTFMKSNVEGVVDTKLLAVVDFLDALYPAVRAFIVLSR